MNYDVLVLKYLQVGFSPYSKNFATKDMLEHREKSSNEKLAELDGKMEAVVGWAKAGYVDFSKFDFTPSPVSNHRMKRI